MDWQRRETRNPLEVLSRKAWAWEFLRRNPAFHGAWRATTDQAAIEIRGALTVVKVPSGGHIRQWGVLFRRRATDRCDNGVRVLGSGVLPASTSRSRRAGATVVAFRRTSAG